MIAASVLAGIWSATITPVDEHFTPDLARALPYYGELLANGCDGLNILGTTGEAMSFGAAARAAFMQGLIERGLPADRVMFGTGGCALDDVVELNRVAASLDVAASLIMPPFYYRDASDDGLLRFFDVLFERVAPPPVLLYNFPRMSGVTFHADLVDRLIAEFPGRIGGMKDSSNDLALQRDLVTRHPEFRIFTGSEATLLKTTAVGGAGCISGSVALWPQLAAEVFRTASDSRQAELARRRNELPQGSLIPAVRERVAEARGDSAWLRAMPPL